MKKYYDVPTQVIFYDVYNERKVGGIAYKKDIICGCCGGTLPIEELIEDYEDFNLSIEDYFEELKWTSISKEIIGQN